MDKDELLFEEKTATGDIFPDVPADDAEEVTDDCECRGDVDILLSELASLRSRVNMLVRDNAELVSDNMALRAKTEALLEARAALPEFSVRTELVPDKYSGLREIFKSKRR